VLEEPQPASRAALITIRKSTDQDAHGSTLVDDRELRIEVAPNRPILIEAVIAAKSNGGYQWSFSFPRSGGAARYIFGSGAELRNEIRVFQNDCGLGDGLVIDSPGDLEQGEPLWVRLLLFVGNEGGEVRFRFANVSGGSDLIARTAAGSILRVVEEGEGLLGTGL
jgi:hypothetical protein